MRGVTWFDGRAAARCRRRVRVGKPKMLQREVAVALGVSRATVNAWEVGNWPPDEAHFAALCALYQCERAELLLGEPPWEAKTDKADAGA